MRRVLLLLLVLLVGVGGWRGEGDDLGTVSRLHSDLVFSLWPEAALLVSTRSLRGGTRLDATPTAFDLGWKALAQEAQIQSGGGLGAHDGDVAGLPQPRLLPNLPSGSPDPAYAEQQFRQGYRDFGGNPAWEEHFVNDVLPCESSVWGGWYDNGYVSKAQFHPSSWRTASQSTGRADPLNPYDVGGNVAWWSNAIEHPGGTGGWPTCWWRGGAP